MASLRFIFVLTITSYLAFATSRDIYKKETKTGCSTSNPADIAFVLDESNSIWTPDFDKQIEFVKNVIHLFKIGPEYTRIAVELFADHPKTIMLLDSFDNEDDMTDTLNDIERDTGNTNTAEALKELRESLLAPSVRRQGVAVIGIIITDGESDDPEATAHEAELTKAEGITLFAIGVGSEIVLEELENIASSPDYMFTVDSYDALEMLQDVLAWRACQVTTAAPPITTTLPQMIEGCGGHSKIDLVFVLPDLIGVTDTEDAYTFIEEVVQDSQIGPNYIQLGLAPRECYQVPEIALHDNEDAIGFLEDVHIRRPSYLGAFTDLHISYLREQAFHADNGGREDAAKVAILVVDNKSYNLENTISEAQAAYLDITLIVIGVGKYAPSDEIQSIASTDKTWFMVDKYEDLINVREDIVHILCEATQNDYYFGDNHHEYWSEIN